MGIQEEMTALDAKIARLKVEYEQYFMRLVKREPLQMREEVERTIRAYSTQSISNTSQKFRYNSLVAKYNSYKQYWTRTLRAIEEGTYARRAEGSIMGARPAPPPASGRPAAAPPPKKDSSAGGGKLNEAYEEFLASRKKCKEPVKGLTLEKFTRNIEASKKRIKEKYKTGDVEVKVQIKDGKTRLTIVPKKG
jgi:hypothetical protein